MPRPMLLLALTNALFAVAHLAFAERQPLAVSLGDRGPGAPTYTGVPVSPGAATAPVYVYTISGATNAAGYDEALAAFDTVKSLDPNYPNLAANRHIAEQSRDAATPWYVKNALTLGIIAFFAIGAIAWFISVRKEH